MIFVVALWLNSLVNSAKLYQPWLRIISNMTLFRDWMGQGQIDGVIWTLEIEAKFYLFILLVWTAIGKGKLYSLPNGGDCEVHTTGWLLRLLHNL